MDTLIASILDAIFSSLAESVGASDWLRDRFGRDPEKLAFRAALTQALTDAAQHFPGRDLRYFAEQLGEFGGPVLARSLQPASLLPTANELTDAWLTHLNLDSKLYYKADFERFATILLESLHTQIENQQPLQWIAQLRTQKITVAAAQCSADAAEQSATLLATMHVEIQQLQERLERKIQTNTGGGAAVGGNVHTGGDFIGRDQITIRNYFMNGLGRLHIDYSARIEEFLLEYLGSRRKRVPFGGRALQLAELDAWLNDRNAPPYYLMTAEAGRGKSALVCRWQAQLLTRPDVEVIFIPISIRFETATQDVVFAAVAARLAAIHGDEMQPVVLSADQWRATCQSYLRRELPDGKQLLVILDGLDEATGWSPGRSLFPGDPPEGLRVVVTARRRAGETGPEGWAATLGWNEEWLARKEMLFGLNRIGVQEALASMGNPLDKLATQVDVIDELFRLTEGDPLLVRLYVDALVGKGVDAAYLPAEQMKTIQPGLHGYFDQWWDEQYRQWTSEGRDPLVEQEHLLTLLNAVAAALGPITHSDLAAISDLTDGLLVRRLAKTVSRWLIGDGKNHGYTFSHPRLGYYFWEQLVEVEQAAWDTRFTDWGETILAALNNGKVVSRDAPRYLVQHYAEHLIRTDAPAEKFYTLMSDGWRQAWEEVDVTYSGFLNDIACAEAKAHEAYGPKKSVRSESIVQQLKAALCRASIITIEHNLSPELLRLTLIHKLRTPTQIITMIQFMLDDNKQYEALAAIANQLPSERMGDALTIAKSIRDGSTCANALGVLAPHLPPALLTEALDTARGMGNEFTCASALAALAPQLPPALLAEGLDVTRNITDISTRATALAALAPHLPSALLADALDIAREIMSEYFRASALAALVPHLPPVLVVDALDATREITDAFAFARSLAALTPYLPPALLMEALDAARALKDAYARTSALAALAPYLLEVQQLKVLTEALDAIKEISSESARARAMTALAPQLPPALLAEAIDAIRKIQDLSAQIGAIEGLAPYLPEPLQSEMLIKALMVARKDWSGPAHANLLAALAPHLPPPLLSMALDATRRITDVHARARALIALSSHLPPTLLTMALDAARQIEPASTRASTLAALAFSLTDTQQPKVLREALDAVKEISSEYARSSALVVLVPQLSPDLLMEALSAAREIMSASIRTISLTAFVPHLSDVLQQSLLMEALDAAREIKDASVRTSALADLVPHMPKSLQQSLLMEALDVARKIDDEYARTNLLVALTPHLPPASLANALDAAREIVSEYSRTNLLVALAPHLSSALLAEALNTARRILSEYARATALAALAPHLPEAQQTEMLTEALDATREIMSEYFRANLLVALAPYLPPELLTEALDVARKINSEYARVSVLAALACHLSELLQQSLLVEALDVTRKISSEYVRVLALAALAPYLPPELLTEALDVARKISSEYTRVSTLAALAPHLPPALLTETLDIAREIDSESAHVSALAALAPHLPPALLTEALDAIKEMANVPAPIRSSALATLIPYLPETQRPEVLIAAQNVAKEIESESARISALAALAPHLSPALLTEALDAIKEIEDVSVSASALAELAPYLPPTLLTEALDAVTQIGNESTRTNVLAALTPHLAVWGQKSPEFAYQIWAIAIQDLSQRPRREFQQDIEILMDFTLSLAGEEAPKAAAGILHALRNVCAW